VLGAVNLISHWEYFRDIAFLREVAFPYVRDALLFYQVIHTVIDVLSRL